jgi:hypothetical protein
MVGPAAALLLLGLASAYWMAIAVAVLHGLARGTRGPRMAAIRVDQTESYRPGFIVLAVPVVKTPP